MRYGDGRVFQYVSRALEDIAPELLGVLDVDMSRLSYLLSARIDNYGELSLHDPRRYGFLAETDFLQSHPTSVLPAVRGTVSNRSRSDRVDQNVAGLRSIFFLHFQPTPNITATLVSS
jgi:hypothetical protein